MFGTQCFITKFLQFMFWPKVKITHLYLKIDFHKRAVYCIGMLKEDPLDSLNHLMMLRQNSSELNYELHFHGIPSLYLTTMCLLQHHCAMHIVFTSTS